MHCSLRAPVLSRPGLLEAKIFTSVALLSFLLSTVTVTADESFEPLEDLLCTAGERAQHAACACQQQGRCASHLISCAFEESNLRSVAALGAPYGDRIASPSHAFIPHCYI